MITFNFLSYDSLPDELLGHVKVSSTFSDLLREIGYALLVALGKLIDGMYEAVTFLLKLDLYTLVKNAFPEFFGVVPTLAWALFGLALLLVGLKLAKSRNKGEASKYIDGILTTALLIVALPFFINALSDLRTAGVADVEKLPVGSNTGSIGETMIAGVTVDIDNSKKEMTYLIDDTSKSPYYIDINAVLDNEDYWEYKIVKDDNVSREKINGITALIQYFGFDERDALNWKNYYTYSGTMIGSPPLLQRHYDRIRDTLGDAAADKAEQNCGTMDELLYYFREDILNWFRWRGETLKPDLAIATYNTEWLLTADDIDDMSWNEKLVAYISALGDPEEFIYAYDYYFLNGIIMMITTLVALVFAALKIGRLLFELIFNQTIAPLVIATDINNEGRRKYILNHIFSTYLVFIVILFVLKLYLVVVLYTIQSDFSVPVQIALMLSGMAFVIDGPDSVVKLLGIDAGVKSGGHAAMVAMSAVQTGTNVAGKVASFAQRGGEAVASVGARGLSSAMTVGSAVGSGVASVGSGIAKGAELGNKIGGGNTAGSIAGGIAGGIAGITGGTVKTAGTVAVETLKTVKTATQATAHTLSPKYDYDRQVFGEAKNKVGRAFAYTSDAPNSSPASTETKAASEDLKVADNASPESKPVADTTKPNSNTSEEAKPVTENFKSKE